MPHDTPPTCPRCGYDLAGIAAAFTDQCPTRGTCSECGHQFSWSDVFAPHLLDLPGFIEHARTIRTQIKATVTTFLWLLWPRHFWSRITIDHPINIIRPVVAAVCLHLALQLLSGCVWNASIVLHNAMVPSRQIPTTSPLSLFLWPLVLDTGNLTPTGAPRLSFPILLLWPAYASLLVFGTTWAVILSLLPATRKLAKLRHLHVQRAAVYASLALLAPTMFACINMVIGAFDLLCRLLFDPYAPWASSTGGTPLSFETLITLSFVWVAIWWYHAINSGWRIQRGGVLWSSLFIASAIASLLTLVFCSSQSFDNFLNRIGIQ